jgi:hypothetical protein
MNMKKEMSWRVLISFAMGISVFLLMAASAPQIFQSIRAQLGLYTDDIWSLSGVSHVQTADIATKFYVESGLVLKADLATSMQTTGSVGDNMLVRYDGITGARLQGLTSAQAFYLNDNGNMYTANGGSLGVYTSFPSPYSSTYMNYDGFHCIGSVEDATTQYISIGREGMTVGDGYFVLGQDSNLALRFYNAATRCDKALEFPDGTQVSPPATPAAHYARLYSKDYGGSTIMTSVDSSGVERMLGGVENKTRASGWTSTLAAASMAALEQAFGQYTHDAVTISDTDTVDLSLTGQSLSADVKKQMSITSDTNGIKLSADSASPGNYKTYGTDGTGTKGWMDTTTVADTNTIDMTLTGREVKGDVKTQMSLTSDTSGIKLSGDSASPGNSYYYGTDISGTKGYFPLTAGGTVSSVSVTTANGVSGTVATATTTPAISLTLGDITPSKVNGNTISTGTGGLNLGTCNVSYIPLTTTRSTNNNGTLSDVTGLGATLAANKTYAFKFRIIFKTDAVTTGIFITVNGSSAPASGGLSFRTQVPLGRNVADDLPFYGDTYQEGVVSTGLTALTNSGAYYTEISGIIKNGASSNNFILQFKSEVSASYVYVNAGSLLELIQLD